MLLVPYCSTYLTMLLRTPVRIEAMTMTTMTPMTIPSVVRKLLTLCARMLSSAIRKVSLGTNDFIIRSPRLTLFLRQGENRIQFRRFHGGVDAGYEADAPRDADGQHDVGHRNRHRHWR